MLFDFRTNKVIWKLLVFKVFDDLIDLINFVEIERIKIDLKIYEQLENFWKG